MGSKVKVKKKRGQVSITFAEVPQCEVTLSERISAAAAGNLALFQL